MMAIRIDQGLLSGCVCIARPHRLEYEACRGYIVVTNNRCSGMRYGSVAKQLDMRRRSPRIQRRNFDVRMAQAVETRLLTPAVQRTRSGPQTQCLIECNTSCAVGNTDRGMVDAEKQAGFRPSLPLRWHFLFGKGEQFERVPVGVAKFEREDTPEDGGSRWGPSVEIADHPPTEHNR